MQMANRSPCYALRAMRTALTGWSAAVAEDLVLRLCACKGTKPVRVENYCGLGLYMSKGGAAHREGKRIR